MFYNHNRLRVDEWDGQEETLCPNCHKPLVAKRGEIKAHHWSHHPAHHDRAACPWVESEWHLLWKEVYHSLGWIIEHPVDVAGKRYVLDAYDPTTGSVREFVHSLSPCYLAKHTHLREAYPIDWLFDGERFGSAKSTVLHNDVVTDMLKPQAAGLRERLGLGVVHRFGRVYKKAASGLWFPVLGPRCRDLLGRYAVLQRGVSEE